jgi:LPXTG-motif cell wall-anchored protein
LTTQPFSTSIVAAVSLIVAVVVIAGLLVYFKKRKR